MRQAQIARYALASGNKAAILYNTQKSFSSVSMLKEKYVAQLKCYVKSSSGNGSRDVAVLQNDKSHSFN